MIYLLDYFNFYYIFIFYPLNTNIIKNYFFYIYI